MAAYYYIANRATMKAECFSSLREAKKNAIDAGSLIYRSKAELPDWVKEIDGTCNSTLKRANGKFAKVFSSKYFNEDIKTLDLKN